MKYELYWSKFVDLKIATYYYAQYIHHSNHRVIAINATCMIVSFTSVIAFVSSLLPPLWSGLILLASQVVSVLQPLYPYSNRLYASKCIYLELSSLERTAEAALNSYLCGAELENSLNTVWEQLRDFSTIEEKFASPDLFPAKLRLHHKAERETQKYIDIHYNKGE